MVISSPRAGANAYNPAPLEWGDEREWSHLIAQAVNGVLDGKINSTKTITLTASSATTTVSDQRLGPNSVILLMPTTANAAAELGNGTLYVSSRDKQTATITHANNAQVDRTFAAAFLG